jgi:hypothetical protein
LNKRLAENNKSFARKNFYLNAANELISQLIIDGVITKEYAGKFLLSIKEVDKIIEDREKVRNEKTRLEQPRTHATRPPYTGSKSPIKVVTMGNSISIHGSKD